MEPDNKILHTILLKKANDAKYTDIEQENLKILQEKVKIDYFLNREAEELVRKMPIKEEDIKDIYEKNKELYRYEETLNLDTIFINDANKAKELLPNITKANFNKMKKMHDEKVESEKDAVNLPISQIHPLIKKNIENLPKGEILGNIIEIENSGAHIVYLLNREPERRATYEESKEAIKNGIMNSAHNNIINKIINQIIEEYNSSKK